MSHQTLIDTLKNRFERHPHRHAHIAWSDVEVQLRMHPEKLGSLHAMEETGGEPDVVSYDASQHAYLFFDCVKESPVGRRSLCYDGAALEARKAHKPEGCAIDKAAEMGITLLTEEQYRTLQQLGEFDTKSSSWILTPSSVRTLGGALFADRRYDQVFVYHNGASSYYSHRGFRGCLSVDVR